MGSARTPYETLFESHSVTILGRFYAGDARNRAKFKVISETVTAFVKVADVLCTNGRVHIVDTVLVPNVPLASIAATAAIWDGSSGTGQPRRYSVWRWSIHSLRPNRCCICSHLAN